MLRWQDLLSEVRDRKSTSKGDFRTQFQRDYDRAIFSTPVRRLQDKAQVFPLEEHDFVRSRLTHSLEVSTVARDLALAASKRVQTRGQLSDADVTAISTIAATVGLLHDIGNPPFGHAGEVAIRDWIAKRIIPNAKLVEALKGQESQHIQDFALFDGNAQTIRLVTRLQVLADFYGLNLSFGTLSALFKYISSSVTLGSEHHMSKVGYFASENDLVEKVQSATGTIGIRNPITFLAEAADDIVNATVDVEDAVKKGLASWHDVKAEIAESKLSLPTKALNEAESIVASSTVEGRDRDEAMAAAFRTTAAGIMVERALDAFVDRYDELMSGTYHKEIVKDSDAAEITSTCKNIASKYAYRSTEVLRLETRGRTIIQDLLDLFWEGAQSGKVGCDSRDFPCKIYLQISSNYRRVFQQSLAQGKLPEAYCRLQLVIDYVAGMTDAFASSQHKRLCNG